MKLVLGDSRLENALRNLIYGNGKCPKCNHTPIRRAFNYCPECRNRLKDNIKVKVKNQKEGRNEMDTQATTTMKHPKIWKTSREWKIL